MKMKIIVVLLLLVGLTADAAAAQFNFVGQFLNRYRPGQIAPAQNVAQTWEGMVQNGELPVGINDLVRLMLESNLDVRLQRLTPFERRFLIDAAYRPFEPTLDMFAQVRRNTTPTTTSLDANVNSSLSHLYQVGYGQTLQSGSRIDVDLFVNRQSSNNPFLTFNPSYSTGITYRFEQPLLRNFGRDVNSSQIRIARNNANLSDIDFEIQVINLVSQAQNSYWDLVSQREDIKVRRESVALAEKTLADNKRMVEIGTLAPIQIVQAEADVAARQEQMVTTTYIADQTQDRIKRMITSLGDPALVLARLNPIEQLKRPAGADIMPIEEAIKYALESRPEIRQISLMMENNSIALKADKNQLLPQVNVFTSYTQSGVGGVERERETGTIISNQGLGNAFGDIFHNNFSGYTVGFNISIPLSNKAAQAAYSQTLTQRHSIEARRSQLAQAIALEVRNQSSILEMNRARIEAASKALQFAKLQLEAEQKKFQLGTTDVRFVLEAQRSVTQQQTNEIAALVNYAKALVEYDRVLGRTLRKNNVEIDKTLQIAVHPVSDSETGRPVAAQH